MFLISIVLVGAVMVIELPKSVSFIIDRLESFGHECFVVGGCVRDSLSGNPVNDWDFTTSATPDEIEKCFSDFTTFDIGKRFGTICVVVEGVNFEITTYRKDGDYRDSRHPDSVSFSKALSDDLSRRDFTINAMAYNKTQGLIDIFDGIKDLKYGVVRCVGEPDVRFTEDALRIMRALRFAAKFGYSLEAKTSESIIKNKDRLLDISSERIISELSKLLCSEHVDFILRRYKDVIAVVIPEISVMFNFDQKSLHHNKDLWRHTVSAVKNTPNSQVMRTAMLLHDIGKPMTVCTDKNGHSHFKNHPKLSSAIANTILKRLKYPSAFIKTVCLLIEHHDDRLTPDSPTIKRYLRNLGVADLSMLLSIQRADILAQSNYKREEKLETLDAVCDEFNRIIHSDECYSLESLAVNGKDIIHLGVTSGEKIGSVLSELLDLVIDGKLKNNYDELIKYSKSII